MLRTLFDRFRRALGFRRERSAAAAPTRPRPTGPADGCVIVRARVFGRDRDLRLGAIRGSHVITEACDQLGAGIYLIDETKVLPADVEKFRQFVRTKTKPPT